MNRLLKFLTKYWIILSVASTIIGSLLTGGLHLKSRIDDNLDTIKDMKVLVNNQVAEIKVLHDKVLRLETFEEAREKGICK